MGSLALRREPCCRRARHARGPQGDVDAPCDSSCAGALIVVGRRRPLADRRGRSSRRPAMLAEAAGAFPANAPRGTPVRRDGSLPLAQPLPGRRGALLRRRPDGERHRPLPRVGAQRLLGGDRDVHRGAGAPRRPERHLREAHQGPARRRGLRAPDGLHEGDARRRRLAGRPRLRDRGAGAAALPRPPGAAARRSPAAGCAEPRRRGLPRGAVGDRAGDPEGAAPASGSSRIVVQAINVDCATARERSRPRGRGGARVAGWTLRGLRGAPGASCRRAHSAVEISEVPLIQD